MKKVIASSSSDQAVKLHVKFEPYERYTTSPIKEAYAYGPNLREGLATLCNNMLISPDYDDIYEDEMTAEQILDRIEYTNGDGADYIILLEDEYSGKVFISDDEYHTEPEEWEWEPYDDEA